MPIYEYHCTVCGTRFEKLVFGSASSVACEKCGSQKTEKLLSRFGMGRAAGAGSPGSSSGSGCGGCSSSSCAGCK